MKIVNLYVWFGNDLAYWLNVTEETTYKILNEMELATDYFIEY